MLTTLTDQLRAGLPLTGPQVSSAVQALTDESVAAAEKAGFLEALSRKGETVDEIAAFAMELRDRSIPPPIDAETRARLILDVCGTGGAGVGKFNISTAVAILLSAAGVTVAKHGNRAITSKSGSADVLEALGIRIDLTPEEAAASLRDRQFAFFFAPKYHPAFKGIGPARKLCAERGVRTIFNFLGPLLNPARPSAQLIGVPRPGLCRPMAEVLRSLGVRRCMIVSGSSPDAEQGGPSVWFDEMSTVGETELAEFYQDRGFNSSRLTAADFPLQPATLGDLAGASPQENAASLRQVFEGTERGPKRDAILLNAAAALLVADRVRSITEGWELAAEVIDSGRARAKLDELAE